MRHRVESVVCDHVRRRDTPLWAAAECRRLVSVAVADVTVGPCYFAYVCRRRHRDIAFSHECAVCKLTFIECSSVHGRYSSLIICRTFSLEFCCCCCCRASGRHFCHSLVAFGGIRYRLQCYAWFWDLMQCRPRLLVRTVGFDSVWLCCWRLVYIHCSVGQPKSS